MDEMYIQFENYLAGEMSVFEKEIFENEMLNDAELRDQFEAYKQTSQLLQTKFSPKTAAFRENLQKNSDAYFAETAPKKRKVIQFKPWQYGVAASLLVFIGTWIFMQNDAPQYSDYNQHEMAMFVERGDNDVELKKAQDFFNAKNYFAAAVAFSKVDIKDQSEVHFFYAITLIEIGRYNAAEILLHSLIKSNSVYKNQAIWYLALSKLKQNQLEDCKSLLQSIPPEAENNEKAQELLKKL